MISSRDEVISPLLLDAMPLGVGLPPLHNIWENK